MSNYFGDCEKKTFDFNALGWIKNSFHTRRCKHEMSSIMDYYGNIIVSHVILYDALKIFDYHSNFFFRFDSKENLTFEIRERESEQW